MDHLQGKLTLTIGGRKRDLFFDYTFVALLNEAISEKELQALFDKQPFRIIPLLAYHALRAGEDVNELPDDFSERLASRWLMEVPAEKHSSILESYKHAMGFMTAVFTPMINSVAGSNRAKK